MSVIDSAVVLRSALKKRPPPCSPLITTTPKKRISFSLTDSEGTPVPSRSSNETAPADELTSIGCDNVIDTIPELELLPAPEPQRKEYFSVEEIKQMSDRATAILTGALKVSIRPPCYQVWMTAETKSRVIECQFFNDDVNKDFQDLNSKVRRLLLSEAAYHSIQTAARQLSLVFWTREEFMAGDLPACEKVTPGKKKMKRAVVTEDEVAECDDKHEVRPVNLLKHWDHFREFWITMLGFEKKSAFRRDMDDVLIQSLSSMKKKMQSTGPEQGNGLMEAGSSAQKRKSEDDDESNDHESGTSIFPAAKRFKTTNVIEVRRTPRQQLSS